MKMTAAIVGCGYISRFHFAALEALGVQVKWVSDLSEDAAGPWQTKTGARYTKELGPILDDPEVKVVHVLTSSPTHAAICRQVLPTGKSVICEKTLTTSADDSLELVRLARKHHALFYTAYMKRFLPAVVRAKELLPEIGPVISCHARIHQAWEMQWGLPPTEGFYARGPDGKSPVFRNNGGGILVCGGSHILDLVLHLMGRPLRLYAEVSTRPGRDYDARATSLMHTADGVLHFEALASTNHQVGFHKNGWDETVELIGVEGKLTIYSPKWDMSDLLPSLLQHDDNASQRQTEYRFAPASAFTREITALYQNIAAGKQGQPSDMTGYEVDEVISTMMKSAQTRQAMDINWRL